MVPPDDAAAPDALPPTEQITRLLRQAGDGNKRALDELVPYVYEELRRRASAQLRHERAGHTLQTTALANEAYLKLVGQRDVRWNDRNHFYAVAATCIRRILVDHARRASRIKRGGGLQRLSLDDMSVIPTEASEELLALDVALEKLAAQDERKARVVELRFFGGLDIASTAAALGVSHATVERDWSLARAWLLRELRAG